MVGGEHRGHKSVTDLNVKLGALPEGLCVLKHLQYGQQPVLPREGRALGHNCMASVTLIRGWQFYAEHKKFLSVL